MKKALQEAEVKAFMLRQLQEIAKEQAKQAEILNGLLRALAKEDPENIRRKLQDFDPFTRWLAIQVTGKKRLPFEYDLIDLLDDPHPMVRKAAHQALVRVARSTDLGPLPKASAGDVENSQRTWRVWLTRQKETQLSESLAVSRRLGSILLMLGFHHPLGGPLDQLGKVTYPQLLLDPRSEGLHGLGADVHFFRN